MIQKLLRTTRLNQNFKCSTTRDSGAGTGKKRVADVQICGCLNT